MKDLRVVLADDHAALRSALRSVLATVPSVTLVGEATNGREAMDLIRDLRPDVALVDIRIVGLSGLEIADLAWAESPDTAVVLLSMPSELPAGRLPAGVAGLVAKGSAVSDIPAALEAVADGRRFVSPSLSGTRSPASLPQTDSAEWIRE